MTGDSRDTAVTSRSTGGTAGADAATAAERADSADSTDDFQAALEAEVARRIDAVERRWQSRKDRELNRARRRWESEAGRPIDPELLAWIAEADPQEVGQWLKTGLTEGLAPNQPDGPASRRPESSGEAADQTASEEPASGAEAQHDDQDDAAPVEDAAPAVDLEREAEAQEQQAERRSQDPSPDLFPSRGAPADAFQQIEAGFARGEVDLETYETARRRRRADVAGCRLPELAGTTGLAFRRRAGGSISVGCQHEAGRCTARLI